MHAGKDVCIAAHIYNVVELADGTRVLDVCSPQTSDADCPFTIVSLKADRKSVGDLKLWMGQDIHIRGVVHSAGNAREQRRSEIFLSDVRQFHGGAEKFRPNPELLRGFSAGDSRAPVSDPALRSSRKSGSSY
uniref:Uncharacterized protein n=1 Tax=Paracidobacterium acidisoli TaxID=2303751 RepID=A0A372IVA4_9BACT